MVKLVRKLDDKYNAMAINAACDLLMNAPIAPINDIERAKISSACSVYIGRLTYYYRHNLKIALEELER